MANRPNSELVVTAWIGSASGLTSSMVATVLPRDTSTWSTNGFITIGAAGSGGVISGQPDPYTELRNPVMSLHGWAVNPTSARPPWGKAAHLLETVAAAAWDKGTVQRDLTMPSGYGSARVLSAYVVAEPRRVPGDTGAYAHYVMDVQFHWVAL